MGRRARWAVVVGALCGGGAFAQPWQPVPVTSPESEPVYVIRTAGQNDRTVKVTHPANPTDPASMAEVKDTATGQTFLIPGKVLAKLPKVGSSQTEPPLVESKLTPTPPPVEQKAAPNLPPDPPPVVIPPRTEPKPTTKPVPVVVTSSPGEKMTTTWRADDLPAPIPPPKTASVPPTLPPLPTTVQRPAVATPEPATTLSPVSSPVTQSPQVVQSSAVAPVNTDPWRSVNESKVIVPTPPASTVGPKLTPVPSWRTAPLPTAPTKNDPWRPAGG